MTFNKTFCRGKSISITYFECVSIALVTQSSIHSAGAMLGGHLSSVRLCHILPRYPTKRHDIRKNIIEHKRRVLTFSITLSETFLILTRIRGDMMVTVW